MSVTDTVANGISGTSNSIAVTGPAAHFAFIIATNLVAIPAGNPLLFTVTAQDQFNSTVLAYSGNVQFSSSDSLAGLPANMSLVSGTGVFSATLKTAGNQTVEATDTALNSVTGVTGPIVVSAAAATHFTVSGVPSNVTAGAPFSFTVTAQDQFNNTATGFTGSVVFSSSDTGAQTVLPPIGLLTSGTGTFSASLTTAGSQRLTAAPTFINLSTGLNASFSLIGSNGSPDPHWTVDQAVGGTAAAQIVTSAGADFSSGAWLADGPNSDWIARNANVTNNGAAPYTFNRTFDLAGYNLSSVLISGGWTIDDGGTLSLNGNQIAALGANNWGTLNSFSVPAGSAFLNQGLNTLTITITTSDEFLEAVRLEGGVTVGLAATTLTAATATVTISPAAASHFAVVAPQVSFAGHTLAFTVTAQDPFNNTATGYMGTAGFSSTDTAAALPASSAFTNGVGIFSVTLNTPGNQSLITMDAITSSISGTSNAITVSGPATHFFLSSPITATAGQASNFTVTALDTNNVTVLAYSGTVSFSSSDSQANLPSNATLNSGVGKFSVTLKTAGSQIVVAADTILTTITGSSNTLAVSTRRRPMLVKPASHPKQWRGRHLTLP